eukprot:TRINITY_DN2751_c0_g1_i1.p1 TRINITY_DN2751_c0_g1~~TRINITY_DN2751_c0_g1_i1.p1  ORF type:complete len:379 (+),score=90.25 TRINITY_DN2751_c0_g1_i1:287-1423(+)
MKYIYCLLFILFIYSVDCGWVMTNSIPLNCNTQLRGNKILAHQEYVIASFDTTFVGSAVGEQMVLLNNVTLEIYDTLNFTYPECNVMLDLENYNSTHFIVNCQSGCNNNIKFYTIEDDKFVVTDEINLNVNTVGSCGIRIVNKDQSNPNMIWFAGNAITSNDALFEFNVNSFTMNQNGGVQFNRSYIYYYGGVVNSNTGYGVETIFYDTDYLGSLGRGGSYKVAQLKNDGNNNWNVINKVLEMDFYSPPLIFPSQNFKNNECFLAFENGPEGDLVLTNFNFVDITTSGKLSLTNTTAPDDGPLDSRQTQEYIYVVGENDNRSGKAVISRISIQSNGQFDQLLDQCYVDSAFESFTVSNEGNDIFVINYCGVDRYTFTN